MSLVKHFKSKIVHEHTKGKVKGKDLTILEWYPRANPSFHAKTSLKALSLKWTVVPY